MNIKMDNTSYENVEKVKYLETTANCVHEETKSKLNWGNAF
jgi:hypothetical protein